jgi:multiple antibiotic resistance protein
MAMGHSLSSIDSSKNSSAKAIAAIIGTPLLTGPAAITAIIISTNDYGAMITGSAVGIVLGVTAIMLYQANLISKALGPTSIQVMSTIMGLITVAWGVKFIRVGLGI